MDSQLIYLQKILIIERSLRYYLIFNIKQMEEMDGYKYGNFPRIVIM